MMPREKNGTEKNDKGGNSLAYRNIGPGQILVDILFFPTIPPAKLPELDKTTVRLNHLRQGARYSVQIIPRLFNGDSDYSSRALFEMKTDNPTDVSPIAPGSLPIHLSTNRRQFQQMKKSETENMRIVSCDPDAIKSGCAWDEMCIPRVEEPIKGWCISLVLRDSILNS
ncbi:hypothetical protein NECAME_15357 [Necator americanus]|uniref:Uncharacterized protein n=1 Tax=Necator americanus TaxID=51031 RepID=W2SKJ3_NECAM|nr:hypothetical protein NECAME_15357 [Necator americanus]ETN69361.1 hypothetical protein NECAME_15357 [Necator americanus]